MKTTWRKSKEERLEEEVAKLKAQMVEERKKLRQQISQWRQKYTRKSVASDQWRYKYRSVVNGRAQ